MLTMTETALHKQAQSFLDSLDHVSLKMDGVVKSIPIWKKERSGNTIRIYVMIGYDYAGTITDVQIFDQSGDVVIRSAETWIKPAERGIYMTFQYRYREVVMVE